MAVTAGGIRVDARSVHEDTPFGTVLQLKVWDPSYRPLSWDEIEAAFNEAHPGKWAVQFFPPADRIVNGKAVYHLFLLEQAPAGLDLR